MRRKNRQTTEEEAWKIVDASGHGVLSIIDSEGKPYCVPLNLWRDGNCLYFHSAGEGFKTDCLKNNPLVSVCFVSYEEIVIDALTTKYSSAIARGTAEEVTDEGEKLKQLKLLCKKYNVPDSHIDVMKNFASCLPRTSIWKINVSEITGKQYR